MSYLTHFHVQKLLIAIETCEIIAIIADEMGTIIVTRCDGCLKKQILVDEEFAICFARINGLEPHEIFHL